MISTTSARNIRPKKNANPRVAAPLEEVVIDAIEQRPGAIEHRCQQKPGQDWVNVEGAVEHENRVGADHREGRMRDVDDIKKAESDGGADAERGIEAAHQQPRNYRVNKEGIGYRHGVVLWPISFL
jgi:hypothetical protein